MATLYHTSAEHRAERAAQGKKWRDSIPKEVKARKSREWKLKTYGMTMAQYDERLTSQGGACAICKISTRKFHIDHDHATGKVRGILCDACNKALGVFGDDAEGIRNVLKYLGATE